jgi:cytochrome c biogenesis protein
MAGLARGRSASPKGWGRGAKRRRKRRSAEAPRVQAKAEPSSLRAALAPKRVWRRAVRELSSLKLALGELAALAVLSGLGGALEQGQPPEYYQRMYAEPFSVFSLLDSRAVLALGLDHVYTTPYFVGLLGLLGASLASCSSTTQWPRFLAAGSWRFVRSRRRMRASTDLAEELPDGRLGDLQQLLESSGFKTAASGECLYASKGIVGRVAPLFVHTSLILTLLGSAASAFGRCSGSAMVPTGADLPVSDALRPATRFAALPPGSKGTLQLNNFYINYYDNGDVSQYYSDFSVVDPSASSEVKREMLYVNQPIRFGGVTVYQTDWGLSSMQLRVGSPDDSYSNLAVYSLPMANLENSNAISGRAWGTFFPIKEYKDGGVEGVTVIARDLQSVIFYDKDGQFVGIRRPGAARPIEVNGLKLVVDELEGSSGLELKHDPGIPLVYMGMLGLTVTTFLSFVSHDQVWAFQDGGSVVAGGKASKTKLQLVDTLESLFAKLPEYPPQRAAADDSEGRGQTDVSQ